MQQAQEKGNARKQPTDQSVPADRSGQERQKDPASAELRMRAVYLAETLAASKDIENPLEALHMKAELAALLCNSGEVEASIQALKNGFNDLRSAFHKREGPDESELSDLPELAKRLAEIGTSCDPSARNWFLKELQRLEPDKDPDKRTNAVSKVEPSVVPDELWGTKPSLRRQVPAEFLARAAHEMIARHEPHKAEDLLRKSLEFCVTTEFISALVKLSSKRRETAESLFKLAARTVRSLPSAAEVSSLSFGLGSLAGLSMQPHGGDVNTAVLGAYLDAMTALVRGPNSELAAKSPDTLRMVKSAITWYSELRPPVAREI